MAELLRYGEYTYAKYLNNRPMSVNGVCNFSATSPPNSNIYHFTLMETGASNTIRAVYLWVYGKQLGEIAVRQHAISNTGGHTHNPGLSGPHSSGSAGGHGHGSQGLATSVIPQSVKIIIDGTDRTAAIGNPNTKPATMWDSTGNDWGNNTGVEWDTGRLDITAYVDLTVQDHYIEFQETGGNGGKLLFNLYLV